MISIDIYKYEVLYLIFGCVCVTFASVDPFDRLAPFAPFYLIYNVLLFPLPLHRVLVSHATVRYDTTVWYCANRTSLLRRIIIILGFRCRCKNSSS